MQEQLLKQQSFEDFLSTRNEPNWLKDYRRNNFEAFLAVKLPKSQYTNLVAIENQLSIPENNSKFFFNYDNELKSKGLIALELNEAVRQYPDLVKKFLEKEQIQHEKFELFSNAFFSDGFFVFSPKNIQEKQLIEVSAEINAEKVNAIKSLIVLEDQSNLTLFEKIKAENNSLNSFSSSIFVQQAAALEYLNYCDLGSDLTHLSNKRIFQEKDSNLNSFFAWFGGKQTVSKIKNHLRGSGSELLHSEIAFGKQKQQFDFNSDIFHEVPETMGRITFKAALDDFSSSIFDGMIKIFKEAQVTNSFLEAHSILLSKNASSNNIPGLEIEANDVKATHAASVHKIDEEELFYLNSRGIHSSEAEKMIVLSFFEALTNNIKNEALRETFNSLLENKYK